MQNVNDVQSGKRYYGGHDGEKEVCLHNILLMKNRSTHFSE